MCIIQYYASDVGAKKWEREVEQRVLGTLHVLTRTPSVTRLHWAACQAGSGGVALLCTTPVRRARGRRRASYVAGHGCLPDKLYRLQSNFIGLNPLCSWGTGRATSILCTSLSSSMPTDPNRIHLVGFLGRFSNTAHIAEPTVCPQSPPHKNTVCYNWKSFKNTISYYTANVFRMGGKLVSVDQHWGWAPWVAV